MHLPESDSVTVSVWTNFKSLIYCSSTADAYPVEDVVAINSKDTTGLEISWAPPSIGGDLTTDFTLTCTPLLVGIPVPDPMSTGSGEQLNISLTGLYPGVSYNCSVVAVTPEGRSTPETIVETTEETGIE